MNEHEDVINIGVQEMPPSPGNTSYNEREYVTYDPAGRVVTRKFFLKRRPTYRTAEGQKLFFKMFLTVIALISSLVIIALGLAGIFKEFDSNILLLFMNIVTFLLGAWFGQTNERDEFEPDTPRPTERSV